MGALTLISYCHSQLVGLLSVETTCVFASWHSTWDEAKLSVCTITENMTGGPTGNAHVWLHPSLQHRQRRGKIWKPALANLDVIVSVRFVLNPTKTDGAGAVCLRSMMHAAVSGGRTMRALS